MNSFPLNYALGSLANAGISGAIGYVAGLSSSYLGSSIPLNCAKVAVVASIVKDLSYLALNSDDSNKMQELKLTKETLKGRLAFAGLSIAMAAFPAMASHKTLGPITNIAAHIGLGLGATVAGVATAACVALLYQYRMYILPTNLQ